MITLPNIGEILGKLFVFVVTTGMVVSFLSKQHARRNIFAQNLLQYFNEFY